MPFQSQAQRRYLYAKHPAVAKEFEAATPKGAKLPQRKGKKPTRDEKVKAGLKRAFSSD